MRITKWGEFGILCSLYLGSKFDDSSAVGAAEIAESQGIPLQYTQQILQRLRKGDIIESIRGPKGGYRLTKAPSEISLKNVLYAAEGNTFEVICDSNPVYSHACTEEHQCGLRTVWRDLKLVVDNFLEDLSLAKILETHKFSPLAISNGTTSELVEIEKKTEM